jgi:hypothetical protein
MAEIVLKRPTGYRVDHRRSYRVFIDGKKAGTIDAGDTKVFGVAAGQHDLQVKVDWATSEKTQVEVGEGDQVEFVCGPQITDNDVSLKTGFRTLYSITLGRNRYIDLRRDGDQAAKVESRSKVPGLDLGALFLVAFVVGVTCAALTGQSAVLVAVVVTGPALVLCGLIARVTGRVAVQIAEEAQETTGRRSNAAL